MQLLNQRTLKLCTVDSVIALRRRYDVFTGRLLNMLVDPTLGEHWEEHCLDFRAPTYVELMDYWQADDYNPSCAPPCLLCIACTALLQRQDTWSSWTTGELTATKLK